MDLTGHKSQDLNSRNFIEHLLSEVPAFKSLYDEHLSDYDEELLPHVLMGDFTRFFYQSFSRSVSESDDAGHWRDVVGRSLTLMEAAMNSADPMLQNLIAASFVENLRPEEGDEAIYGAIKPLLGSSLRRMLSYTDPDT